MGSFSIPGWGSLVPGSFADDSTVAMTGGLLLFLLPADRRKGIPVLSWKDTAKIPFGVLFLFGGGFCLAEGFRASGLSSWITSRLDILAGLHIVGAVAIIALLTTFLTELTSNTATASLLVPLLASLAGALRVHPLLLLLPATLSASCAFMLPVATPPNAVVFGSGLITIRQMARTGFFLNLIGAVVITILVMIWAPVVLGVDFSVLPEWTVAH
jgi:sodium-dependent dicarboxylate transporter 2/3/5